MRLSKKKATLSFHTRDQLQTPLNINYISNSQIRVMLSRKNLEEAKECLRAQPGFKFQVSICLGNSEVRSCLGGVADRVQDFLLNLNFT